MQTAMTHEQEVYCIEHINDRPRYRIAEKAGISTSTLYRIIRDNGGEMRHALSKRNPEIENVVRTMFPTMSGSEIQQQTGFLKGRIEKIARELGVKHTPETLERLKRKTAACITMAHTAEAKSRANRSRLKTIRIERFRVLSGQKQHTKLRIAKTSMRTYKAKWHLQKYYNYFTVDGDDPYIMIYDDDTRRANENFYIDKYGLKFVRADD